MLREYYKTNFEIITTGHWITDQVDRLVHRFHKPMVENLSIEELETLRTLIKKFKNRN
jgi:hypothetical protein